MSSEVADVAFQATKGEVPSSDGGYRKMEPLLQAKNLYPHDVVQAEGDAKEVRAVLSGKAEPEWHGLIRNGDRWVPACDEAGEPVVCSDAPSARDAAMQALERGPGPAPCM